MSLRVIAHFDGAVYVHCTAAARLLRGRLVVLVVFLERRAAAARPGHAGCRRFRLLLCAAGTAAPQALQFSLGGRGRAAGEWDGRLHRSRRTTGVGSFTYAHSQHGEQRERELVAAVQVI